MPMTIWVEDGFHLRVRDGRVLLLMPGEGEGWRAAVECCAAERVVGLGGVPVESAYSGLYEMSPDGHAILGRATGCENFFLANGSSGHGVMHAPALGQLLAEMIVHGEARSLDARGLRPSRFAEGRPNPASELL
jgi:sarcosine oxidase subunit beta